MELYPCPDYLEQWLKDVKQLGAETAVRVVKCYSDCGTYSTLNLELHGRR